MSTAIALTSIIPLGISWAIASIAPKLLSPRITELGLVGIGFVIVGLIWVALGKHND